MLVIGFGLLVVILIAIASAVPRRSVLSKFELERRRDGGNNTAAEELKREVLLDDVLSLKKVTEALFLVLVVAMGIAAFGWLVGCLLSLVIALIYNHVARLEVVNVLTNRLYAQYDERIIGLVERHPTFCRLIRSVTVDTNPTEISSREELEYLVEESGSILTSDEKKMIVNGLHFNETRVEQIMTPRGVIDTIDKQELIGPLALDELHRTGHSRFPVIDGDIDHVIGVLHIRELLTLDHKDSETAAQAMEKKVFYINQAQTLQHALAAFIKTRHHLFVVVNGYRETAGILTLEDVMEALLGREIVDEFDVHDDLRLVAERSSKYNNNPTGGADV